MLNLLPFWTLGSFANPPPCADVLSDPKIAAAPAPTRATADACMNVRRRSQTSFGVISDERISAGFFISIKVIIGPLPQVSIVIPVLHDFDAARALLFQIGSDPRVETILVDGDFDDRLDAMVAARQDVRLVRSRPGRAHQMNAGAALAQAPWLFFLHADSTLPNGWLERVATIPADVSGAWFRFRLDDPAWQARAIEWGVAIRVRLFGLPYGDQGMVVRRDVFRELRGFPDLPLMEDVAFVRLLRRSGPTIELPLPLTTSARRWRSDGWWRRSARNLSIALLYMLGVSPAVLARQYDRRHP